MKGIFKGICFCGLLFLTSFFGSLVCLAPFLPMIFLRPTEKLGKWIMDKFIFMWKLFAVALYEVFIGIKIVVKGEAVSSHHLSQLVIMNHRTRLDWLFVMSYQIRYSSLEQFVISLKGPLKYIPGPGWAMQCGAFLFLDRKWDIDSVWITKCIAYFKRIDHNPQLLFFPEGTDLTPYTKARSDVFAEKNGVNKYEYVLHPRTTGFIHMVKEMRDKNRLDGIIDITVAYPKYILQNESDIIHGRFPEEIHFYVQTYKTSDIPQDLETLGEWCQNKWSEKEKRLSLYYEKKEFTDTANELNCEEQTIRIFLYLALLFWFIFLFVVFYSLVYVWYFKWYCLLSSIVFTVIQKVIGGVDNVLFSN